MSQPAPEWLIAEVRRAKRGTGAEMVTQTLDLLDRFTCSRCATAPVPQPGRVLLSSHRHFPHSGRGLHPMVRLLRRDQGQTGPGGGG